MAEVKFVSYTGKFPCKCSGVLTVEIDGEAVTFGPQRQGAEYRSFWVTGGSPCSQWGRWWIDEREIPAKYAACATQLGTVFNANVKPGCCGGCS